MAALRSHPAFRSRFDGTDELARSQAEVIRLGEELNSFTHSVSHDLGAPLRAVVGFAEALQEECGDQLDGTALEYVNEVRKAGNRMRVMLGGLITLANVADGSLRLQDTDLSQIAHEITDRLRETDCERDVTFVIGDGLRAFADPDLIRLALVQLLENAWRFTSGRAGAGIEFGRALDGSFFLRDNGAGFDSRYKAKLFAPFQVLHGEEDLGGLGLGLAIVARIVHRHGGQVWAQGEPGRGATFSFTLPPGPRQHELKLQS
jgi:signal transduction histidine kinase